MRWAKNYERLQEIQRQLMWPPVTDFDHRIFIPEVSSLIIAQNCYGANRYMSYVIKYNKIRK